MTNTGLLTIRTRLVAFSGDRSHTLLRIAIARIVSKPDLHGRFADVLTHYSGDA